MRLFAWILLGIVVATLAETARAGNSGLNVIVVVNQNSTNSVQLGNAYREQRGVPPQNVFRMTGWSGGNVSWPRTNLYTLLINPLLAMVAQRGLTNQATVVLLSMDIPYFAEDGDERTSTTSSLYYGFKTNGPPPLPCLPGGCALPDASFNSYAYSEMPFACAPPDTAPTNAFLAMMLTASNLNSAELILSRGIASDSTYPTQTVYLEKTSDDARNVRWVEFDNAQMSARVRGDGSLVWINRDSTSFTNALGLLTGLANFSLPVNAYVAGALGDSLTSYGGAIFESSGQTTLFAFLSAGASGSYGTIVEPCAYTQKFPDPMDYFYQNRGFSLAEAYYQSLLSPYQGLMCGEPLSAPFARPGSGDWSSLTNNTVLSGHVTLTPSFAAAVTNLPLGRVDLFLDGTFYQTMTNLPPAQGNLLSVTLNGITITNGVPTNSTLWSLASTVAADLNIETNLTEVIAFPIGDRLELQSLNPAARGSDVTLTASTSLGSGTNLATFLIPALPDFMDTAATGYTTVLITNSPIVGDWIQLNFIETNGTPVTVAVTNTVSGASIGTLVQNLANAVNANAQLQASNGLFASDFSDDTFCGYVGAQFTLYSRLPGFAASEIQVTLTTSTNLTGTPAGTVGLQDNINDLRPRNHLYLSSGAASLAVNYPFDTTQIADGFHQLTAVAYEGTSVRTQTRVTRTVRIQNTSLSATFTPLLNGTNATLDMPLQFSIAASATNIARIELFSTGGSIGVVSNQSSVVITAPSALLSLGLHPFYAVVTDTNGKQYQTQTLSIRLIPSFKLSIVGSPAALSWSATSGQFYNVLATTNLGSPFQLTGVVQASNSVAQWPFSPTNPAPVFYRVQVRP